MVDRDIVVAKLATIDRCIGRIEEVRARAPGALQPVDVDDIVLVNLQRAIQAAIDLAAHIVSVRGYGLADSIAAEFSLLEKNGVISLPLAKKLRAMVGFRNIAVHEYQTIDPNIVEAIVTHHLQDLRNFGAAMVRIA